MNAMCRERVRIAEEKFSLASANRKRIQAEREAQPSAEGSSVLAEALKAEDDARLDYMNALQALTEALLRPEEPPDENY